MDKNITNRFEQDFLSIFSEIRERDLNTSKTCNPLVNVTKQSTCENNTNHSIPKE